MLICDQLGQLSIRALQGQLRGSSVVKGLILTVAEWSVRLSLYHEYGAYCSSNPHQDGAQKGNIRQHENSINRTAIAPPGPFSKFATFVDRVPGTRASDP